MNHIYTFIQDSNRWREHLPITVYQLLSQTSGDHPEHLGTSSDCKSVSAALLPNKVTTDAVQRPKPEPPNRVSWFPICPQTAALSSFLAPSSLVWFSAWGFTWGQFLQLKVCCVSKAGRRHRETRHPPSSRALSAMGCSTMVAVVLLWGYWLVLYPTVIWTILLETQFVLLIDSGRIWPTPHIELGETAPQAPSLLWEDFELRTKSCHQRLPAMMVWGDLHVITNSSFSGT